MQAHLPWFPETNRHGPQRHATCDGIYGKERPVHGFWRISLYVLSLLSFQKTDPAKTSALYRRCNRFFNAYHVKQGVAHIHVLTLMHGVTRMPGRGLSLTCQTSSTLNGVNVKLLKYEAWSTLFFFWCRKFSGTSLKSICV